MMFYYNKRKVTRTEAHTREGSVAEKNLIMLLFEECGSPENFGLEKKVKAVNRAQQGHSNEILKDNCAERKVTEETQLSMCRGKQTLKTNGLEIIPNKVAAFCLCPKNLSEAKLKFNFSLVKKKFFLKLLNYMC